MLEVLPSTSSTYLALMAVKLPFISVVVEVPARDACIVAEPFPTPLALITHTLYRATIEALYCLYLEPIDLMHFL